MSQRNQFLCLLLLILAFGILSSDGTHIGDVDENVRRYARQHFEPNWQNHAFPYGGADSSANSIKEQLTKDDGKTYIYLPHEVILIKRALSEDEQKILLRRFIPSAEEIKNRTDQSLCSKESNRCTLYSWNLGETPGDNEVSDLGDQLFKRAANKLDAFQRMKSFAETPQPLKITKNKFNNVAVHGVLYNKDGFLQSHLDKSFINFNGEQVEMETEWVISISIGNSALFRYEVEKSQQKQQTTLLIESGDVILFNGGYLLHEVTVLQNTSPEWSREIFGGFERRFNLQFRMLTDTSFNKILAKEESKMENTCLKPDKMEQPYLMREQDKPRKMEQPYLMRVRDKPRKIEQPYLMRVQDKPRKMEQPYLMRVQDKPRKMEQPYLMRVQDKPKKMEQPYLMRVQDKPRKVEQPYLMRVQDKPSNMEQPYLMRVQDKPRKMEQPYLMRVQDKPRKMEQPYLMRVQNKPKKMEQPYLMRVQDKPRKIEQPYLNKISLT